MKKKRTTKSKVVRSLPSKTLSAKKAKGVRGGRKAGKGQMEFLVIK